MQKEVKKVRIGPMRRHWKGASPGGDCPECGGQCSPECGEHPAGCVYGGLTEGTSYWLIADDCPLYHGEEAAP